MDPATTVILVVFVIIAIVILFVLCKSDSDGSGYTTRSYGFKPINTWYTRRRHYVDDYPQVITVNHVESGYDDDRNEEVNIDSGTGGDIAGGFATAFSEMFSSGPSQDYGGNNEESTTYDFGGSNEESTTYDYGGGGDTNYDSGGGNDTPTYDNNADDSGGDDTNYDTGGGNDDVVED